MQSISGWTHVDFAAMSLGGSLALLWLKLSLISSNSHLHLIFNECIQGLKAVVFIICELAGFSIIQT